MEHIIDYRKDEEQGNCCFQATCSCGWAGKKPVEALKACREGHDHIDTLAGTAA